jgi:ankyrin repeat protein
MQIGHSKVFLRRQIFEALELLRNRRLGKSAIVVQKHSRRFLAQLQYYDAYMAVVVLQSFARKIIATRTVVHLRDYSAATKIQCSFRRFLAETNFFATRLIAQFCQAYWRGVIARKLCAILLVEKHALTIQRGWRRFRDQRTFRKTHFSCVVVQCLWRQRQARQVLRGLRFKARDLDAVAKERDRFREESIQLRKEVELLKHATRVGQVEHDRNQTRGLGSPQEGDPPSVHEAEVERLKMEVEKLRSALTKQNEILNPQGAGDKPPESVIVRKMSTWSLFGNKKDDTASQASSLGNIPYSPQPAALRVQPGSPKGEWNYDSPPKRPVVQEQVTPLSWPSFGFNNPAKSSSSISLLDAERHTEIADYQLESTTDTLDPTAPRIYSMTTMQLPHQKFEADLFPVEKRRGVEFTEGLRSLHQAVSEEDYNQVCNILRSANEPHVIVNELGEEGQTALHVAVEVDDLKISRVLIDHGAIVNVQNMSGDTPLHLSRNYPMAELLLETGRANPNIPNMDGICALHLAVQRGDASSVRILLKHYAKVDTADNVRWLTPLHLVAMPNTECESRATIADLLCSVDDPDLNYQDSEGNTPLHYAVQIEGRDANNVINALLEKGASPKIPNSRKQEPLLLICHNDALRKEDVYQECLHSMLFYGADPNQQSSTGATPLHLSLYHKDLDSAIQLVNRAAELHLMWRKVREQDVPRWKKIT